jgi:hypothetical protein
VVLRFGEDGLALIGQLFSAWRAFMSTKTANAYKPR